MIASLGFVAGRLGLVLTVAALLATVPHAQAQMTEYPVPTGGSSPYSIVTNIGGATLSFTEAQGNNIGTVGDNGTFNALGIPTSDAEPQGITVGNDGNTWFTEFNGNKIGKVVGGVVTEYAIPTSNSGPTAIVAGPDGNQWFTEFQASQVAKITSSGIITEYPLSPFAGPAGIVVGPDNALWVAEMGANSIAQITTGGSVIEYILTTGGAIPFGITVGSDGALWFTESGASQIGRITTAGAITNEYPTATASSLPKFITSGPDGALWFTEQNANMIGRISTSGVATEYAIPTVGSTPNGITEGPNARGTANSAIWFTELGGNKIGTFTSQVLTVTPGGSGSGTVTSSAPDVSGGQINCGSACSASYVTGTTVTLTATAMSGSTFAGWSGACAGTDPCQVTMSAATSVAATFSLIPSYTLTVGDTGTGTGTVTSNPSGINCGSTCQAGYQSGTTVTLIATPAIGSTFTGWSGSGCSGTGTCQITLSASTSVRAKFVTQSFALTVSETGSGSGLVTSSPSGIDCSSTRSNCSASYAYGTQVTLTASAAARSSFAGWSGGGCSGTETCQITLSADTPVTATFNVNPPTRMLSVGLSGGGSGTVTSSPSGINCGSTCSASFDIGTQITLSAAAANGSTFAGWSGGSCVGASSCALTLNADTTVTAGFISNSNANVSLLASVLPDSRSVEVGTTANAFATILNIGTADGTTCSITPVTAVGATFAYQTTDPSTNAATGTPNTPATIPPGGSQSFVLAFTPTAAFSPTDISFAYICANAPSPAQSVLGLNTFNLSGSTTSVPDIIAIEASGDPGYLDLPPSTGVGAFAVATSNLGAGAAIIATTGTGTSNLPVTVAICQTNPSTGACLAAPSSTATLEINSGDTDAFGVFVSSTSAIPDMPAVNRIFVQFTDTGGTLRGETSVAVRTQ
jgi:streptogramin lyase